MNECLFRKKSYRHIFMHILLADYQLMILVAGKKIGDMP